jgi:hypothetical protein
LWKWEGIPLPVSLALKTFTPKFPEIPKLVAYKGVLPDSFWAKWTKKTYENLTPVASWINPGKMLCLGAKLGWPSGDERLVRSVGRLRGADTGCRGPARLPTKQSNSDTAFVYGDRVCDTLQGWIKDGLCFGPVKPEEMPWTDYTINPITVKLKPTGAARVCINMSAPYKRSSDKLGQPASVNSGIDKLAFPATMSTTSSFCKSLMRAGCPAQMCKSDWNQAQDDLSLFKLRVKGREPIILLAEH